jgi:hypothetical protein
LTVEYASRYGVAEGDVENWLRGYPAAEFEAPAEGC